MIQKLAKPAAEASSGTIDLNVMRSIKIDKLTLNFGAGKDQKQLEKGIFLIKQLTGKEPVKTITTKRIVGPRDAR